MISKEDLLFPHSEIRDVQEDLIKEVLAAVENKTNLIAHAPTGLGKCVSGDTIILTEDGLKKISDIYLEEAQVNSISKYLKTTIKKSKIIRKKRSKINAIKTRTGRSIKVTEDHKFLTIKSGTVLWKKQKDLKIGDYIACSKKLLLKKRNLFFTVEMFKKLDKEFLSKLTISTEPPIKEVIAKIKHKEDITNKELAKQINCPIGSINDAQRRNEAIRLDYAISLFKKTAFDLKTVKLKRLCLSGCRNPIVNLTIDEDFAYFVGLLIGDGFISNNKRKEINFSNTTKSLISFFDKIAKRFGSRVLKKHGSDCDYLFHSKPLVSLLYSLDFPKKNKSAKVKIPDIFFNNPKLLSHVLSGIYDTDGSVYNNTTIELITKSENLKDSVMHALLAFGIYAIVKEKYVDKKKYFRIYTCNSKDNNLFYSKIGFRHKDKQKRLSNIIKKSSNSNIDIIPEISKSIKKCRENLKIPYVREHMFRIYESYIYKQRAPSRDGLDKLIRYFKKKTKKTNDELNFLIQLANSDIFWDKIISIDNAGEEYVYDANVPETHNFIGNGIVLHNTAATIPIALSYALKNKKTVFFLTSRHTHHKLVIDTLKQIKKEYKIPIIATDIIGKKWMCLEPGAVVLYSNEFAEYCKSLKEHKKCNWYNNTKKNSKLTKKAEVVLEKLKSLSPSHIEELIEYCKKEKLCPYEMASLLAKEANVIVGDYNYIFDPGVAFPFLTKSEKELKDSIIIVDEAHNLPKRVRDNLTIRLTNIILKRAIKEAAKHQFFDQRNQIEFLFNILEELSEKLEKNEQESLVTKEEFMDKIKETYDYDELITDLMFAGEEIRKKQRQSYLASIASFLEQWPEESDGFARIITKKPGSRDMITELSSRCLDPSISTKNIIEQAHSIILISGTLNPTFMYKDILGFEEAVEKEFKNPFPKHNKLSLVIPETSTKYTRRSTEEFQKIAKRVNKIADLTPGNTLVFFPSYSLRNNIYPFINSKKEVLLEKRNITKEEKNNLLEEFKQYKDTGSILLAVAAGNFGEGVDLPGDYLKTVIVVGLPLEKPTLEIKKLIEYYDKKFNKGWDYGYVYPAIIKVLQNAGRCIRSETDKGVIIFLDERFAWDSYYKCFPTDQDIKISKLYEKRIEEFFSH